MAKILIVDDSPFIRLRLKKILAKKKHVLIEAGASSEAIKIFKKEKPDFVLLDIIMPEGEEAGVNALKEMLKANPKANIVMLTAVGYDEMVGECKSIGAKEYVVKPFDEKDVLGVVEKYL